MRDYLSTGSFCIKLDDHPGLSLVILISSNQNYISCLLRKSNKQNILKSEVCQRIQSNVKLTGSPLLSITPSPAHQSNHKIQKRTHANRLVHPVKENYCRNQLENKCQHCNIISISFKNQPATFQVSREMLARSVLWQTMNLTTR